MAVDALTGEEACLRKHALAGGLKCRNKRALEGVCEGLLQRHRQGAPAQLRRQRGLQRRLHDRRDNLKHTPFRLPAVRR